MVGHEVIDLSWPMAFALGAIVSPTDPVAATAIMRRLGAPRRIVNVIEGESLVNDATALVAYRVAVAAARRRQLLARSTRASSSSAPRRAASRSASRVGFVVAEIRRRLDDTPTELTISLLTALRGVHPGRGAAASRACSPP